MNIQDRIREKLGDGFTCELIDQRPGENGGVVVRFLAVSPVGCECYAFTLVDKLPVDADLMELWATDASTMVREYFEKHRP